MTLSDALCQPPRESAGPRTADLFDYQLDWALTKLLTLHEAGQDYVMLLDHHDDVVVTNSAINPTELRFFQVKTQTSRNNWTLVALTDRANSRLSIVGKLYDHRLRFGPSAVELALVSNARYRVRLRGRSNTTVVEEVECTGLSDEDIDTLRRAITAEHELGEHPDITPLALRCAGLPVRRHGSLTEGELGRYLARRVPDGAFRVSSAYSTIKDELRRKNNLVITASTFDELAAAKGITRAEFEGILRTICRTANPWERWQSIATDLAASGVGYARRRRLSAEYKRVEAQLLDPTNELVQRSYQSAKNLLGSADPVFEDHHNRATVLKKVADRIHNSGAAGSILDREQVEAIVLHAMDDL